MAEQLMGIDYFSLETDIKDDDKIFDLKYRYGMPDGATTYDHAAAWAAYGRFIDLLGAIYHEGFAVELTNQKRLRLSQQLGMEITEFDSFVQTCVDVGLFDSGLWCQYHVLTSRGIQRRYFHAAKRRKGDLPEEVKPYILIAEETPADAAEEPTSEDDAYTVQTSCEHDANTMYAGKQQRIKEKRIEKNKKEEDRKGVSSSENVENVSSIVENLSARFESGPSPQPYPLACFGCISNDGTLYNDDAGGLHQTPWDALLMRFRNKTGEGNITAFAQSVAAKCPAGCSESHEQVSECYFLLCEALDKYDSSKAASPIPLALKVIEDRGKRKRKT